MSLTINGSGGGITASEAVALTGWNTIASFPVNTSGTITETASSTLCDVSSYEDAIKEFGEVRWRAELTKLSITGAKNNNDYVLICANTATLTQNSFSLGYVSHSASIATNVTTRCVPFFCKKGTQVPSSYWTYGTTYWYFYPSTGTATYSSADVTVMNLLLKLGKYSSTSGATYIVQGTFYLEGRY